ncbi:TD and POZ domain-containing protein 5 [Argiope bruennichi]|uniref:TD and POZ domain-containing protein 5 n=1 Tax=Argiope bruennichi TaxID=94029 RepID=A0A8T0FI52_ARGBR|nr:TD and POZ domain-containing protein 5 [Argiope bruennichi]
MSKSDCVSFNWAVNNFRYSWQKPDEAIVSPTFFIYMPEETKWGLRLFPRGTIDDDCISLFLYRYRDCNGPEKIEVEYSLEMLAADDSILANRSEKEVFGKDTQKGFARYQSRKTVTTEALKYLPRGILTVRCRMIQFEGKSVEIRQIFARTNIRIENRFFLWLVEKFSSLTSDNIQSFSIKSASQEDLIKMNIHTDKNYPDRINFTICSFDRCMKFAFLKISIVDYYKKLNSAGEYECWLICGKCSKFQFKFTKNQLMDHRGSYLNNDVLTLKFELTISTEVSFQGIEIVSGVYTSNLAPNVVIENWRKCILEEKKSDSACSLITDLADLLEDKNAFDMKLQTKTNVFPVHTLILSARSPVFKAMFSTEMKERINGCVDVSDLDDKTVIQFLVYMYTDQLDQNLEWDDVLKLYRTADKYAVTSLKEKCSAYLKENLNLANACEAWFSFDCNQTKS